MRSARYEYSCNACLNVRWRTVGDGQHAPSFEVLAFRRVLNLALLIYGRADRIRERSRGVVSAWVPNQVDVVHEAVIKTCECAVSLRPMSIEFLGARRVQIESHAV